MAGLALDLAVAEVRLDALETAMILVGARVGAVLWALKVKGVVNEAELQGADRELQAAVTVDWALHPMSEVVATLREAARGVEAGDAPGRQAALGLVQRLRGHPAGEERGGTLAAGGIALPEATAMSTTIAWTQEPWKPVIGCSRVSEGCRHCYAERQAIRQVRARYAGIVRSTPADPRWTGELTLSDEHLDRPRHWPKPRRVFVNSMSDLFHERMPEEWIARVFAVVAATPQHTYQILTKRPERAATWPGPWPKHVWGWARASKIGAPCPAWTRSGAVRRRCGS